MAIVGITTSVPSDDVTLTLDSLITRVARLLRRTDLNTEIKMWLNFVQTDVANRVHMPELRTTTPQSITLADNIYSYGINSNFLYIDRIIYQNNITFANVTLTRNLDPLPRTFWDDAGLERGADIPNSLKTKGDPQYYLVHLPNILFWPVPDKASVAKIYAYQFPIALSTGGQTPDIALRYRNYLILLTYYWGSIFLEKDDMNKVLVWDRKYKEIISDLKQMTHLSENKSSALLLPESGMEFVDQIY